MSDVYIECPGCGSEDKVDEALVGRRIKCAKCGESFTVEIGGSYDLQAPDDDNAAADPSEGFGRSPRNTRTPAPKRPEADDDELDEFLKHWPQE